MKTILLSLASLVLASCAGFEMYPVEGPLAQGARPTGSVLEIPPEFHGTWTWHADGVHPSSGEYPWVVSAKTITAHESYASVRLVILHGDDAITVTEDGHAEGEEFTDQKYLKLSADRRRLEVKGTEGEAFFLYRVKNN